MAKLTDNFKFLESKELSTAKYKEARTLKDAFEAADEIGYPIILKANTDEHKTEIKGVSDTIHNALHLKKEWARITEEINKNNLPYETLVVQQKIEGTEIIVGAKKDSVFDKVVMIGSGGTLTEITKDISFRVIPVTKTDAKEMVSEIKASKLLEGYRGAKKANKKSLTDTIKKFSEIFAEEKMTEADLNPIIVNERKAWIVDARLR